MENIVEYRVVARTITGEEDIIEVFPSDKISEAYAIAESLEQIERHDWSAVFVKKVLVK
jgi:hypothetical protein